MVCVSINPNIVSDSYTFKQNFKSKEYFNDWN